MISRLKEKFASTNKLTKLLFKYGFITSYVIFTIGIYMLFRANDYDGTFIAQEVIRTSFSILGEFIISAIFFDFLSNTGN